MIDFIKSILLRIHHNTYSVYEIQSLALVAYVVAKTNSSIMIWALSSCGVLLLIRGIELVIEEVKVSITKKEY